MPLLRLSDNAILDTTDGVGVILDTQEGVYFELNQVATLMVEQTLRFDSLDEVISRLGQRIDATDDVLRSGLESLIAQLDEHRLIEKAG